jgi:hypothetical protein
MYNKLFIAFRFHGVTASQQPFFITAIYCHDADIIINADCNNSIATISRP